MPKLDLRNAKRIKNGSGEILRLKSSTFSWTKPVAGPMWVNIVPTDGGPNAGSTFFRGNVTQNADGSYRVTTAPSNTNGRAAYPLPAVGRVVTMESSIAFNDATRLIARQVTSNDQTGGITIFDVNRPSVGAVLTRTDTFTVQSNQTLIHFIGVSAAGQYFTINPATRWWWETQPVSGQINSVVVIGASLMFAMFGQDLSTPNSTATTLLANAGHNIPVYGNATNGATLSDAVSQYNAARAAHPNALIIMHLGGNDVTNNRVYPGGTSIFNTGLANLQAVAANDTRFYPASITFRDYNDTTFQYPENGSKPYNENIMLPWITQNFPNAMASYGRPKFDFYRRSLQDYETWLQADNVHMTTTGYTQFREFIVARIADILNGVTPAQITERVYANPVNTDLSVINFTWPSNGPEMQIPYNNVNAEDVNIAIANILNVNGASSGFAMNCSFTGNPVIAATSSPGRGRNSNGRTTGLAAYANNLLCSNVTSSSLFITSGVTAEINITGCVPGASYEIGMVGSRSAADVRNTVFTVNGVATTWNSSEEPPLERRVTTTATAGGVINTVLSTGASTAYAYIGGISIRRVS